MRYLLIDFGASFIKTAIYNSVNDSLENFQEIKSPFIENSIIKKDVVQSILLKVVNLHTNVDRIVACSMEKKDLHVY